MSYAIRIHEYGGPEVFRCGPLDPGEPGRGQVRIRHTAIGLNFIDVYERTGLYRPALPAIPGREAAGVVEAIGAEVNDFAVGDRVAYVLTAGGAYSSSRVIDARHLVRLPAGIDDRRAASIMLKGLTAHFLLRRTYHVRRNDFVLLHAAAGGVGLIALQWARHLGARVIAVVGSEAKADLVREYGADRVVLASTDWPAYVKQETGGRGVHVAYDSVGKETFQHSLEALRPRGMMVSFGNSSGAVPPIAPLELSRHGSLFLTRPTLFDHISTRAELLKATDELFRLVAEGVIRIHIGQTYALRDAAEAHRDLEGRRTNGASVLLP